MASRTRCGRPPPSPIPVQHLPARARRASEKLPAAAHQLHARRLHHHPFLHRALSHDNNDAASVPTSSLTCAGGRFRATSSFLVNASTFPTEKFAAFSFLRITTPGRFSPIEINIVTSSLCAAGSFCEARGTLSLVQSIPQAPRRSCNRQDQYRRSPPDPYRQTSWDAHELGRGHVCGRRVRHAPKGQTG